VVLVVAGGGLGYRAALTDTGAAVLITASPGAAWAWTLAVAALFVGLCVPSVAGAAPAPPGRVLFAWAIDFTVHLIVAMVPNILLALWLESRHTGAFAWTVSRETARPTDVMMWAVSLVAFAALWAAPGVIVWAGRSSAGGLIANVSLQPDRDVSLAKLAATMTLKYFVRGISSIDQLKPGGFALRASKNATLRVRPPM
jgi:hypothetical protein